MYVCIEYSRVHRATERLHVSDHERLHICVSVFFGVFGCVWVCACLCAYVCVCLCVCEHYLTYCIFFCFCRDVLPAAHLTPLIIDNFILQ